MDRDDTSPDRAGSDELTFRRAGADDRTAMIELCRASLGWNAGDPNEEFFAWKHDQNPFGRSPAWLAVAPDGSLAGLRVLMNWRFTQPLTGYTDLTLEGSAASIADAGVIRAVRAVDTATHPDWQGKGIFRRLTLGALDELGRDGLDVVFNTPNDQSRPGYLKMGWAQVGRVPVAVRLRSPLAATHMAGAKAAAQKWSQPSDVGIDAARLFADDAAGQRLLDRLGSPPDGSAPSGTSNERRISTQRSVGYLQWRYSFEPLRYRALPLGDDLADGVIVFRVRGRGTATEMTVCEILGASGPRAGKAVGYLLRATGADYAIATYGSGSLSSGFVPAPRLGPVLTWREVTRMGVPAMGDLALALGDVELF